MFKKGNNIFSLLVVILSIFMTSTSNIVNADSTGVSTPQTATTASTTAETDQSSTTDWGNQLITKVQLQDSTGQPMTEFHQNDNMRAYWEFSTANKVIHSGDTMEVLVPQEIALSNNDSTDVYQRGTSTKLGEASLNKDTRTITVTFNDTAAGLSREGAINVRFGLTFPGTSIKLQSVKILT